MGDKVKIGILGCANIVKKYAIKSFQSIPNAEVVSIASRDYNKAKDWAAQYGIQAEESYDALLANNNIDAVYIPLPIGLHKEWVLKSAAAKKHVICEKSLAESFASVKEIVNYCKSNGIILYENFMCDYHPQHEKVLSLIKDGSIGKPFVFQGYFGFPLRNKDDIRYNKDLGGGSLNDLGAYTVFMARKILLDEPVAVTSKLSYVDGIDLSGTAQLEFSDGKIGLVAFSFDAVYQNNYSVWGDKGIITVGRAYGIPPDMKPNLELLVNENLKESRTSIEVPAANHFELIFSDFCDKILNKNSIDIYSKLLSQARALEAVRISSKDNRKVYVKEII